MTKALFIPHSFFDLWLGKNLGKMKRKAARVMTMAVQKDNQERGVVVAEWLIQAESTIAAATTNTPINKAATLLIKRSLWAESMRAE